MTKLEKTIDQIETAIKQGQQEISKLAPNITKMRGMSSRKFRHFLNNLITNESKYLEIGVWRGSTFISALYNNAPKVATGIDNFSEFRGPKDIFLKNCQTYLPNNIYNFIDKDCFKIDLNAEFKNTYNIYFYDGNHEQLSQELALTYYLPILEDIFILLVDDWCSEKVKVGTKLGIAKNNLKILYEKEIYSTGNDSNNWWNGLYIAILAK